MSFRIRELSVLAYANGFTMWHYKAGPTESLESVKSFGYFNDAADMLAPGDMIMVSGMFGATILVVAQPSPNTVMALPLA